MWCQHQRLNQRPLVKLDVEKVSDEFNINHYLPYWVESVIRVVCIKMKHTTLKSGVKTG